MRQSSSSRRRFIRACLVSVAALLPLPRRSDAGGSAPDGAARSGVRPLHKTLERWRAILEPERYAILFEESTERPFSSVLDREKRPGTFVCAACYLPLFTSRTKYDSGSGWPSFWAPIDGHVATKKDYRLLLPRTEYHCARCGGHQGHVFADGPPPSAQRWCNNGLALVFVPAGSPPLALRE